MYAAANGWSFPAIDSAAALLHAARDAGFDGLELVVGTDGPLRPDTPPAEFAALADQASDLHLKLTSLATGLFWERNYGHPDADVRQEARDLTLRLLERAAAAGAGAVLVVPAVVGHAAAPRPVTTYADALYRTIEALLDLAPEAEAHGVALAIENVWNRFLLSPVEAADLIDQISSPAVGFYFDTGNVLPFGYPEDWIVTLGARILRVHAKDYDLTRAGAAGFCELGAGSVNWPAVVAALERVGYDGPLTYEGAGEPRAACARLNAILAGESPLAVESAP